MGWGGEGRATLHQLQSHRPMSSTAHNRTRGICGRKTILARNVHHATSRRCKVVAENPHVLRLRCLESPQPRFNMRTGVFLTGYVHPDTDNDDGDDDEDEDEDDDDDDTEEEEEEEEEEEVEKDDGDGGEDSGTDDDVR